MGSACSARGLHLLLVVALLLNAETLASAVGLGVSVRPGRHPAPLRGPRNHLGVAVAVSRAGARHGRRSQLKDRPPGGGLPGPAPRHVVLAMAAALAAWLAPPRIRAWCRRPHSLLMAAGERDDPVPASPPGLTEDEEAQRLLESRGVDVAKLVRAVPLARHYSGQRVQRCLAVLEGSGVNAGRAMRLCPKLVGCQARSVQAKMRLLAELGLDAAKVVRKHPSVLLHQPQRLQRAFDNLAALGLPPTRVLSLWPAAFGLSGARLRGTAAYVADLGLDPAHVLARYPQLFSLGLENMEDTVLCLRYLRIDVKQTLRRHPQVMGFSTANITGTAAFLEAHGIDAVRTLNACPQLLGLSVLDNLTPKLRFLTGTMGRAAAEVNDFPPFFTYSLAGRIQPRYRFLQLRGRERCTLPSLLAGADDKFARVTAGCAVADYRAWLLHRPPEG